MWSNPQKPWTSTIGACNFGTVIARSTPTPASRVAPLKTWVILRKEPWPGKRFSTGGRRPGWRPARPYRTEQCSRCIMVGRARPARGRGEPMNDYARHEHHDFTGAVGQALTDAPLQAALL